MRADVISQGVAAIQASETQALSDQLGAAYDAGLASAPPSGGLSQADVDAAIAAQKLADDSALSDIKAQLAALAAKEGVEASVIAAIQAILNPPQNTVPVVPVS